MEERVDIETTSIEIVEVLLTEFEELDQVLGALLKIYEQKGFKNY